MGVGVGGTGGCIGGSGVGSSGTGVGSSGTGVGSSGTGVGSSGTGVGSSGVTGSTDLGLPSSPDVTTMPYTVLLCDASVIPRLSCRNILRLPENSSSKWIIILSKLLVICPLVSAYDEGVSDSNEEASQT